MDTTQDTRTVPTVASEERNNVDLMNGVVRGDNPIPPILPRVAYGLSSAATSYTTDVLSDLKNKGFNVVSAEFATTVYGGTGLKPKPNTSNTTDTFSNAEELGMRVIPGVSISISSDTLLKEAWDATISAVGDIKSCPAWLAANNSLLVSTAALSNLCGNIISTDKWLRPVLFNMLPADSAISDLGGSPEAGWTEDNKYDKYCQRLFAFCPPMVWWTTQRGFAETLDISALNPLFLKSLKIVKTWADNTNRAMWSTVHSSFLIPNDHKGENELLIPTELATIMKARIGLETRCALAMGVKGLVFDTVFGNSAQYWYPLRTLGHTNPLGDIVKELNSDLEKVREAFVNTELWEAGVVGTDSGLEAAAGNITLPCSILDSVSGQTSPLLIARLRSWSKEFFVIVNLSTSQSQHLKINFINDVTNLNPYRLIIKPISEKAIILPPILPSQEREFGLEFISNIAPGGWRVFSYLLPVTEFGFIR